MLQKFITAFLLAVITAGLPQASLAAGGIIRLATTTSTENSGLLKALLPRFEKETGYRVHVIAVGTGKALRLAREGNVDAVLVHARRAEDELVDDGFGINRRDVMYNDFVIVGPAADPARIRGMGDAVAALARIASAKAPFISRGDDSGTHKKELALWRQAGIEPRGPWYREAGQGMGKVLQMAGELSAYALTDRGTWLALYRRLPLEVLTEGDVWLYNPYGILAVNPEKYPDTNAQGAKRLIDWITSRDAQEIIRNFTVGGEPLFIPTAGNGG